MPTLTVRAASADDIPNITALWYEKAAVLKQADPHFAATTPDSQAAWAEALSRWLDDPNCAIYVAEHQGRLVGYIIGWIPALSPLALADHLGMITTIALDTHTYYGGLGRSLYKALCAWFSQRGVKHIIVAAPCHHPVEQAFWRALGATEWMDLLWIKH